jgi:hypothetical protein
MQTLLLVLEIAQALHNVMELMGYLLLSMKEGYMRTLGAVGSDPSYRLLLNFFFFYIIAKKIFVSLINYCAQQQETHETLNW